MGLSQWTACWGIPFGDLGTYRKRETNFLGFPLLPETQVKLKCWLTFWFSFSLTFFGFPFLFGVFFFGNQVNMSQRR